MEHGYGLLRLIKDLEQLEASPSRHVFADALVRGIPGQRWIAADLHQRMADALARSGYPHEAPPWSPTVPDCGETYVLTAAGTGGRVFGYRLDTRPRAGSLDRVLSAESLVSAKQALDGLIVAMARDGIPAARHLTVTVPQMQFLPSPDRGIIGDSLGLSTCVCLASSLLGRPALPEVAGTADIDSTGKLQKVGAIGPKIEGLRKAYPSVKKIVIAEEEENVDLGEFEFVRRGNVLDALEVFGLHLRGLEEIDAPDLQKLEQRVEAFRLENDSHYELEKWLALRSEALYIAKRLPQGELAATALAWAAIFATHAAEPDWAMAALRSVREEALADNPLMQTWRLIMLATTAIDNELYADAEEPCRRALLSLEKLYDVHRREIKGRVLGTVGRVHMHAGRYDEGVKWLREGVAFHQENLPREAARTACYLATCLRMGGDPEQARQVVEEALHSTETYARYTASTISRLYLRLERGRCRQALRRLADAAEDFEFVDREQAGEPRAHPKISAIRGLAAVYRRIPGYEKQSIQRLNVCLKLAKEINGKPAAMAAADAILDHAEGSEPGVPVEDLWKVWLRTFEQADTTEKLRRVRDGFVY
jgi:tetratricopeptide (TPR) repeat protein